MPLRHSLRFSICKRVAPAWLAVLLAACVPGNDITRAPPPVARTAEAEAAAPPPLPSGKLPPTVRPLRYEVALAIDPTKDRFTGDVTVAVEVPATTSAIVLHGHDLTIIRAEVIGDGPHISAKASFRPSVGAKEGADELVLSLSRPLHPGRAELRIAYSAPINDKLTGLYRVKREGAAYAFTQFEPTDARRMLPCFDEPRYKVPFDLKVTVPKGSIAIANTGEVERTTGEDGRSTTFRFAPTPPLSTYLFAVAVGPFEIREAKEAVDGIKLRLITTQGKSGLGDSALETAAVHLKLLGGYFGRPYPYPKLDLVAVPEFGFGATGNAGLISLREDLILLDSKSAAAEARRAMATNLAHEISHHWFGNLVTLESWDDLWLSEGFASWMASKIVDTSRPTMEARLAALVEKGVVMSRDALGSARSVRKPAPSGGSADEAFDDIAHEKSAAVLGMLEAWLGHDAFREGVRAYIKGREHGVATAADLFQALSAASGKDVWPVAATFFDQPGVPLIRAELSCERGSAPRVKLTQERHQGRRGAAPEAAWRIPVCVDYEGADKTSLACGLMASKAAEIALPSGAKCPRFIYPNAREEGYFRFVLPPAQMAALVGASRSLDVRSRIGLIQGAWSLVQSGDMAADVLLDLLAEQKHERHRLVIEQVIVALESVSGALIDEGMRPAFRRYVSAILLPLAKELGWDAKKGEGDDQKLLRRSVFGALSTLAEDAWFTAEAEKRAAAYWKDPRAENAEIATVALRAASRRAGDKRFVELLERARKEKTPEGRIMAIRALGSFADPNLLRRALDLIPTAELKGQDGFYIFDTAMLWAESRPHLLAWVKEHIAELKAKMPDFLLTRLADVVGSICDEKGRDDAARFFGEALKGIEGAERALSKELELSELCIEMKRREAPRVKRRLEGKRGR
jgi:aminopeptidase N